MLRIKENHITERSYVEFNAAQICVSFFDHSECFGRALDRDWHDNIDRLAVKLPNIKYLGFCSRISR